MEKKNLKQEDVKRELYANAGCNLVVIPVTLIVVGVLAAIGLIMFQYYFFGLEAAFIEPFQDRNYLYMLIGVIIAILLVLTTTWRNFRGLYQAFRRYRLMQHEQTRIQRLVERQADDTTDNHDLLLYAQDDNSAQHQTKLKN